MAYARNAFATNAQVKASSLAMQHFVPAVAPSHAFCVALIQPDADRPAADILRSVRIAAHWPAPVAPGFLHGCL